MDEPIFELQGVAKRFQAADGHDRVVLQDVDFTLQEGEIVALLGPSGSGKSTLLRILAGLIPADAGRVHYRGAAFAGPVRGVSMVFQSFALFPWLTVQQNVELGLEARGVARRERQQQAAAAIELIGLAGFEGALPRELSGGMRQRVGIARALVTQPDVLLMDEAFSALDVLTGERLREDILALWQRGALGSKALLVVSHNIEEAVLMADRVLVLGRDPGRVRAQLHIGLPRPRDADSLEVRALIDEVYAMMTAGAMALAASEKVGAEPTRPAHVPHLHLGDRLPSADVARIDGLLELLAAPPFEGRADLPRLAEASALHDAELLPAAHAVALLGLAKASDGDLALTPLGRRYVAGSHTLRHEIFGQELLERVPLAAHIRNRLEEEPSGALAEEVFLQLLSERLSGDEARRVLHTVIEWGRHGEVFGYDLRARRVHLPEGDENDERAPGDQRPGSPGR